MRVFRTRSNSWMRPPLRPLVMAAAAVLAHIAHTAGAQAIRPYRPAWDVADYSIAVELPDTGSIIAASAVITVTRTAPSDSLRLDLLDLRVDGVSVDGRAVRFGRPDG